MVDLAVWQTKSPPAEWARGFSVYVLFLVSVAVMAACVLGRLGGLVDNRGVGGQDYRPCALLVIRTCGVVDATNIRQASSRRSRCDRVIPSVWAFATNPQASEISSPFVNCYRSSQREA